jgi:hypothetical protein
VEQSKIIICPKCQKKLRVPSDHGLLSVRCPICENRFYWDNAKGIITADYKPVRRNFPHKVVVAVLVLFSAIGLFVYLNQKSPKPISSKPRQPKWVIVSYADLLDSQAIIRTGQELKSALGNPHSKGAVQPFVDRYSFLLQHTLEIISGSDQRPYNSVIEEYPLGSAQPAWVSILRGGRINITTDGKDHVRVFLLGDDGEKSYEDNYSLIRHCLNALAPTDGSNLGVDVFAYKNDYASSELRLNLAPYTVVATAFPPKGVPVDLAGLSDFFDKTPEIEGAQLDRSKGLMLYGKFGAKQTLAGANLSLSDFAVAYRAVFHAGDNEAFISLDPHRDPAKVTVNFGGFLEDTRIGCVVLEADKRFKTITSGLDPNTLNDLRKYTRRHVPSFLSVAEQDLLDSSFLAHGKWVGTRFWFYPDSVNVESDLSYQYALITNPQFLADAERSRDDFASPEEFERKKNATLSPSIRKNIDHLNQNYAQYANAFGELRELTTVARLMGICSWLYKANPRWLDLDALLSVELPPLLTAREKTQLIAACIVSYSKADEMNADYVIKNSTVTYLSPVLDKRVSDYFGSPTNLAKYLCLKNGKKEEDHRAYEADALRLFNAHRNSKVKDIILTKGDVEALASYSAHALDVQKATAAKALESNMKADKEALEKLQAKIEQIKRSISSASSVSSHDALVDQHNELVSQYKSIRYRYNQAVSRYNSLDIGGPCIIEISGGINLEPRNFRIKTPKTSAKLQGFREIVDKIGTDWRSINGSGKWIKNGIETGGTEAKQKVPKLEWTQKKETVSGSSTSRHFQADSEHQYWSSIDSQTGSWRDCRKIDRESYQERVYEAESKKLQIAEFHSGRLVDSITGEMNNTGRIIFRKSGRKDIGKPQEPPIWFLGN